MVRFFLRSTRSSVVWCGVLCQVFQFYKEDRISFVEFGAFFTWFFLIKKIATYAYVFSPKNFSFRLKKFWPQNKKRRKTTRHTMYSAISSIPSGGPPGGTHTQELWYSLRGTDARLQSVSSADKCPCHACWARFSTPIFVAFLLVFCPTKFF